MSMANMDFTANVVRTHLDYTKWASNRLVGAASTLALEELTKDFGTADHSVVGTLAHIFAADRVWLGRILGNPPVRFIGPEDVHIEILRGDWLRLLEDWKSWARGQSDESLSAPLEYKDLKGNTHATPVWQIVLHVVNHGTHHRGQVSGFLRAMGYTPPPLDLIAYYRSL